MVLDHIQLVRNAMIFQDTRVVLDLLPQIISNVQQLFECLDGQPQTALCRAVAETMEAISTIYTGVNENHTLIPNAFLHYRLVGVPLSLHICKKKKNESIFSIILNRNIRFCLK